MLALILNLLAAAAAVDVIADALHAGDFVVSFEAVRII